MIRPNRYKDVTRIKSIGRRPNFIAFSALAFLGMSFSGTAFAYPDVKITNNTPYPVSGKVEYVSALCKDRTYSVAPGQTWIDRNGRSGLKTGCLVGAIDGKSTNKPKFGENNDIITYDPDIGTSYSQFMINAFGDRYRIFSENEFKNVSKTSQGRSPGFRLVNKTNWPVAYSFDQVGCLYHGVLPSSFNGKDGTRTIKTGAVWFTLRAHIRPDGVDPQGTWDCIKPVAEIVGDVLVATAATVASVATAGAASPAAGAAVAKIVAKQAIKTAVKVSIKNISKKMAKNVISYISEAGTVTMAGQYAGYEWPFRCENMPEYHITGGPGLAKDEDGDVYLTPGPKFTVKKVNSCGNDMMLASPKLASAETKLPFPTLPKPATTVTVNETTPVTPPTTPTSGGNVTVYQHCNYGGYAVSLAPGKYTMAQLQAKGIKNDDLSSIKIPNGMIAKAYQHDNFQGQSWSLTTNESCFVSKGLNDVVSAIEITAKTVEKPVNKTVNGLSVKQVSFNGGAFVDKGAKRWVETDVNNVSRFNFTEVGRDEWSVYLKDSSRDVNIQLDLHTRKIMYNRGSDPKVPLYNISGAL